MFWRNDPISNGTLLQWLLCDGGSGYQIYFARVKEICVWRGTMQSSSSHSPLRLWESLHPYEHALQRINEGLFNTFLSRLGRLLFGLPEHSIIISVNAPSSSLSLIILHHTLVWASFLAIFRSFVMLLERIEMDKSSAFLCRLGHSTASALVMIVCNAFFRASRYLALVDER